MNILLKLVNQFDDTEVLLTSSEEISGPFIVSLVFNDRAIATEESNESHTFEKFDDAVLKFTELVKREIKAVQGEIR